MTTKVSSYIFYFHCRRSTIYYSIRYFWDYLFHIISCCGYFFSFRSDYLVCGVRLSMCTYGSLYKSSYCSDIVRNIPTRFSLFFISRFIPMNKSLIYGYIWIYGMIISFLVFAAHISLIFGTFLYIIGDLINRQCRGKITIHSTGVRRSS